MHILLLLMVTSGLVLLQTTQGVTTNLEPDADFLEEAMADGFIVSTKGPTKTEIPQNNYNAVITHDSLNPEANLSLFQKDSQPTATTVKTPEASTKLSTGNTNELPKNESAAVLITVGSSQTTTLSLEENPEGSGILPEQAIKMHMSVIHTTLETVAEVDSSEGSGMIPKILNEKQNEDLLFTTTVRNFGDLDNSTLVSSSEENGGSGMGPEKPTSVWLTTTSTITEEKVEISGRKNNVAMDKPTNKSSPDQDGKVSFQPESNSISDPVHDPQTTVSALLKKGTPDWLLILALCLILGAIICVFAGIATKDMWYGPSRKCLNLNSTDSTSNEKYDKAATLPLSEKVALMSAEKEGRKEIDCSTISLEDIPEKEYLM